MTDAPPTPSDPRAVSPALRAAIDLYQQGKLSESATHFRALLGQNLEAPAILRGLAYTADDPEEAVAAARLALVLEPTSERAQQALAHAYGRAGESDAPPAHARHLRAAIAQVTGMSLAQARAVAWPFKEKRGTAIGELLDQGAVVLRDLGFAIENARDTRVRAAATTLLLTRLLEAEPTEMPRAARVVQASRYGERQERRRAFFFGIVMALGGLGLVLWVIACGALVLQLRVGGSLVWPGMAIALLVPWLGGVAWWMDRLGIEMEQYVLGRYGEEKATDALRTLLDGRWTLFRNWEWPSGKGGDIDLLLVGPGGVWACEVKAYTGHVRNQGEQWERRGKRGWFRLRVNPTQQVRRNAGSLRGYLHKQGVTEVSWVQPVILWANEEGKLDLVDPAVPVWRVGELDQHAEALWQGRPLAEEAAGRVVEVLERAAEARRLQRERELKGS